MKRTILFLMVVLSVSLHSAMNAQNLAIKTNALYWATTTPNLEVELALAKKLTFDVLGGYNPFTFENNKKVRHWLVQPELRYWFCEKFNGHFFGVHLHGGYYNIGGVKLPFGLLPELRNARYEGGFYGGGLSYGYQWILKKRWSLEAGIGLGYARFNYDKYQCPTCGDHLGSGSRNYFGVSKAAVSLIYTIK